VKRMIRILAVAVLVAVILVASLSPALAKPRHFGHRLGGPDAHAACDDTHRQPHNNERGAHHEVGPGDREGCWVVLPGQG
jgi:hypothetical protein